FTAPTAAFGPVYESPTTRPSDFPEEDFGTAAYEYLVISDSDVRVSPNYLRDVVRPLLQPEVGLVTCLYRGLPTGGLACGLTGAEDGVTRFGKRSGISTS